ncbi:MAG: glucose-6-phosphate isomerase, partial [Pseudomonadales bacterium]|nr:glucose-6-phosphate isomerase [Pseudomonadales bacterium]
MDITRTAIWKKLERHAASMSRARMTDLFEADPARSEQLFLDAGGLQLDYSRNLIDDTTLDLLEQLTEKVNLTDRTRE